MLTSPPLPTRPSGAAEHGWKAVPARLTMDQDYERRLLRQIVIQNENTMPCVSAGAGVPAPSCPVEPVGWSWWGPRCAQPLSLENRGAQQVTHVLPHGGSMVTPRCEPRPAPPHTSSAAGATDPSFSGGLGQRNGGSCFALSQAPTPSAICRLPNVAGCAHRFSALLALCRLSRVGSFPPLPVPGAVGTPWPTDLSAPPLPCLCIPFLCELMSLVSSEDIGLRFGAALLQCELILT